MIDHHRFQAVVLKLRTMLVAGSEKLVAPSGNILRRKKGLFSVKIMF